MGNRIGEIFEGIPLGVNPLELIQGARNVGKGLQIMNKTAKTLDRTYTWFVEPAPTHQRALKIAIAVLSATTLVVSISFASPYIFALGNAAGASLLVLKIIDQYQQRSLPLQEARPNPPEAREERKAEAKAATHVDQSQEWVKEFNSQPEDWSHEFQAMHQTPVTTDPDALFREALEDFERAAPLPAAAGLQTEMHRVWDQVSARKNLPSTLGSWSEEFERVVSAAPVPAVPAAAAAAATAATVGTAAAATLSNTSIVLDVGTFVANTVAESWVAEFAGLEWVSEFIG